jgi:hypothetical protein
MPDQPVQDPRRVAPEEIPAHQETPMGKAAATREFAWPGIVRHGQSTGNAAADQAERSGAEVIDITERDADVPLSPTGIVAELLGRGAGGLLGGVRTRGQRLSPTGEAPVPSPAS